MQATPRVLSFLYRGYNDARVAMARGPIRLAVFTALALAAKWQVLGKAGLFDDTVDAEHFTLYEEAARLTVTKFHELPLWNPYFCGGISAVGTPSARFASPPFLLTLLFGTLRAEPLILMVMTVVGLEGVYRYVRACGGGAMGAALAAPVFALCGCFAKWPVYDWTNFYGFQLVPWALYGARGAFRGSRRGVVVLAVAVAWIIGFGGTYAAPLTALAAGWEGMLVILRRTDRPRAIARVVVCAGAALVFVVAVSLFRLWPIAETLSASPRILGGTEGANLGQLWKDLFAGKGPATTHGAYLVGIAALPIFFLGGLTRRALPFLASSLAWLWLSLGYSVKGASLFGLLRVVPPFTMLRAPERFLPLFVLGFAVVISLAFRRVEAMSRRRPALILVAFVGVAVLGWNLRALINNDLELSAKRAMVTPPAVVNRPFHQTRGNRWLAFYYLEMSRGVLACFDDYNVAQSPDLLGDLPKEEYLRDPDAGTVTETAWAPNRLDLHVELSRPARVYVNENWHPGWHTSAGTLVSDGGLLAVDLPAGQHDVVLRFLPRSAIAGGLTSIVALIVALYVWRRTKTGDEFGTGRTLAREVGVFASPLLVAGLGFAVLREPARPPVPLLTPEGDPIVASAPPEDATPVGAAWLDQGIMLQAYRVKETPAPSKGDVSVTVELDWRLFKKPPPGLGIAVRIDGGSKGVIPLNYALYSGALLIEDAPLGKTVRDVSEQILVPAADHPQTMRIWVGLSYARRDGRAITNVRGGLSKVSDGRIIVGSFIIP